MWLTARRRISRERSKTRCAKKRDASITTSFARKDIASACWKKSRRPDAHSFLRIRRNSATLIWSSGAAFLDRWPTAGSRHLNQCSQIRVSKNVLFAHRIIFAPTSINKCSENATSLNVGLASICSTCAHKQKDAPEFGSTSSPRRI